MNEIKQHEWFLRNLPAEILAESDPNYQFDDPKFPPQSVEEIMRILQEAKVPGTGAQGNQYLDGGKEEDDDDMDDVESSGEFVGTM